MNIVASEVGIDVSKAELVISIDQCEPFKGANTAQGCQEIASRLPAGCIVHLESSGGYERTVEGVLRRAGFHVEVHNPYNARRLAQGRGRRAKTDLIDAKVLSENGRLMPSAQPKADDRRDLSDFSRAIDNVKETIADYKKRRNMPELDEDAKLAYNDLIKAMQAQVKKLELKFVGRMKKSSYKSAYELAQSVPCIGPICARVCVCELPENLDIASTAQVSSYAGLAPVDDSSGQRNGPRRIGQGNGRLRRALYMSGITALATQPWATALYARLRAKGRTHKQAMVAIMRRLLVRVVIVLQRGSPWQAEPRKA